MLDVTLLGTGGGMPLPGRYLSATLITYRGNKILIDCGEGTQVSMREINSGFKSIDMICITHIHCDHIIGLPGLLGTIGNSGRVNPLLILGPEGISEAVSAARVIAKYLPYEINVIENPQQEIELYKGEIVIKTLELDHSSPCIGYQLYVKRRPKFDLEKALSNKVPKDIWNQLQKSDEPIFYEEREYYPHLVLGEVRKGIKVSLVTDTRPILEIIPFIEGSDLFICEGTYAFDEEIEKAIKNKHMTFKEAATLAKKGSVKSLLLTHFGAALLTPEEYASNARNVFESTVIGRDHLSVNLNFSE